MQYLGGYILGVYWGGPFVEPSVEGYEVVADPVEVHPFYVTAPMLVQALLGASAIKCRLLALTRPPTVWIAIPEIVCESRVLIQEDALHVRVAVEWDTPAYLMVLVSGIPHTAIHVVSDDLSVQSLVETS